MAKETRSLSTYQGRAPDALRLNFSGEADNLDEEFDLDSDVVLIVRGKVKDPSFKTNQFGVLRLHQRIVVDHAIVADEPGAKRLMKEIKRREDEAAGQESLDADIDKEG